MEANWEPAGGEPGLDGGHGGVVFIIPTFEGLRQENLKFEYCLHHTASPCVKTTTKPPTETKKKIWGDAQFLEPEIDIQLHYG